MAQNQHINADSGTPDTIKPDITITAVKPVIGKTKFRWRLRAPNGIFATGDCKTMHDAEQITQFLYGILSSAPHQQATCCLPRPKPPATQEPSVLPPY